MAAVFHRLAAWHRAHWTTPAPMAAGVCRVVLAGLFLLFLKYNLPDDYRKWAAGWPAELYRPVGVLAAYGPDGPPVKALVVAHWAAKVGVWFLLVGLFTRTALVVTGLGMWHCCSATYAFAPHISHTFIPALVAAAGLLAGARSPLSVDYLLARRTRPAFWTTPRAGVAMVIFAVGWSFANAALHKAYLGNKEWFAWCYSDNLRNLILYQHLKLRVEIPDAIGWVIARPWAYKTAAVGNVLCQFLPVFAAFMVRRPWLRAALAAMVTLELLGLGFVMRVYRGYGDIWLLFPLVFIDWDALLGRVIRPPAPVEPAPDRWWWGRRAWVMGLSAAFVVLSCRSEYVRPAYPLLPFSMFSPLYVNKPYLEHQPYPLVLAAWEIESTPPLTEAQADVVFKRYHEGLVHPKAAAEQVRAYCEKTFRVRVDSIRGVKRTFVLPPPPDLQVRAEHAAEWVTWTRGDESPRSLVRSADIPKGTREADGTVRYKRALDPKGLDLTDVQFEYATLGSAATTPLPATTLGPGQYELAFPKEARGFVYVTARVKTDAGAEATYYVAHMNLPE